MIPAHSRRNGIGQQSAEYFEPVGYAEKLGLAIGTLIPEQVDERLQAL